jgi:adenylate kinase
MTSTGINLEMDTAEVHRRVLSRRLCEGCGLDYNLMFHRPERADTCDVCGGRLIARDDDNPEALAVRIAEYHAQTRPVLDIFDRKEYVATVDASAPIDVVQADIRAHLAI